MSSNWHPSYIAQMTSFRQSCAGGILALLLAGCASTSSQPAARPQPKSIANAADVEFMSGMIHHHAQAILIAGWAPSHNASESLQRLAERIKVAQQDEIDMMQTWLRDRGLPVEEATPTGMKMKMGDMEHVMLMPGMLSEEQLAGLDRARGKEFDRLFLTYMIQHHRGALTMVDKLLASYGAAQDETVFRFSSDVVADQTTEIDRMERMLTELESR